MPYTPPPPDPLYSVVQQVAGPTPQEDWARAQELRAKQEAEQRQREMEAEQRRRIQQTQQMR